ncbi:hypothetical protein [Salinicola peritrichatus]|uniref:hypothetical protein n=1 Tax=Salinicola peritrichatus TaxID=1267424 RepID=UPI0013A6287D|nr:hypothetical protein [Salinicola peritrichatus]
MKKPGSDAIQMQTINRPERFCRRAAAVTIVTITKKAPPMAGLSMIPEPFDSLKKIR